MSDDGRPKKEDRFWIAVGAFALFAITATVVTFVWIATENPITTAAPVIPTPSAAATSHTPFLFMLLPVLRMAFGG
jgi:hypothetical protein